MVRNLYLIILTLFLISFVSANVNIPIGSMVIPKDCGAGNCVQSTIGGYVCVPCGGSGGNPFNQPLNTSSNVAFNLVVTPHLQTNATAGTSGRFLLTNGNNDIISSSGCTDDASGGIRCSSGLITGNLYKSTSIGGADYGGADIQVETIAVGYDWGQGVTIDGQNGVNAVKVTAPNVCYSDGTNCQVSQGINVSFAGIDTTANNKVLQIQPNSIGDSNIQPYSNSGIGVTFFGNTTGQPAISFCGVDTYNSNSLKCTQVYMDTFQRLVFNSPYAVSFLKNLGTHELDLGDNGQLSFWNGGYSYTSDYGVMRTASGVGGKNAFHYISGGSENTDFGATNYNDPHFFINANGDTATNQWNLMFTAGNKTDEINSGKVNLLINSTNVTFTGTITTANATGLTGYVVCYLSTGTLGHCTSIVGIGGTCTCVKN